MGLTITQRPGQVAFTPSWVAAKNPMIYKMTRKDFSWTTLVNSAGNTSIQIATDVTASFVAGDTIWLQSDDGAYSATGTVVSSAFGAATTVITTVPYVANNASGYINITSRRPNYYVGVSVYTDTSNTVLLGTVNYYPNKKGEIVADISQPVLTNMDAGLASFSIGIIRDSSAYQLWNIKYSEYWTGSSPSFISDNAYSSYGIFGAKQIGQNTYYSSYLGKKTLSIYDSFEITTGEYYCLTYVSQLGGQSDWVKKSYYDASKTIICATYVKSTNGTNYYDFTTVPKGVYTLIDKLSYLDNIYPYVNITNIGAISWSGYSITISTGNTTKTYSSIFYLPKNSSVTVSYDFTLVGNATNVPIHLYLFDSSGTVLSGSITLFSGSNGNYTGTATITNSGSSDAYFIGFDFTNSSGANKTLTMNSLKVSIPTTVSSIDFQVRNISNGTTYVESTLLADTITAYVNSCTKNPMTLFWRNSLGGMSSWTFDYSQDLVQKLQTPFKNNWYTLYDNSLTLSQFNALNELFSVNQIYQTPLIELTTSVDKTEARIGQQVYVIDSNGNKTGVVTIGGENKTITKRNRHNFLVTIEMPEIFG